MEYAYLNAFVNALSALFEMIFSKVFAPILTDILEFFSNYIFNVLWNMWSEVLIGVFVALCSLIDFIESIFNVFAGISPVIYKPVGQAERKLSLLDVMFEMEGITLAFWMITLAAMGICIIFTIYKTAQSISDMALEDKNPISKVLTDAMKAGFTFLLIPFLCVMMLQLSSTITQQTQIAFNEAQGGDSSIGTILFLSATLDADKKTTEPKSITTGEIEWKVADRNPSFDDEIRKPYLLDSNRYQDLDTVRDEFHAGNVNYLVGFICGILIMLILLMAILTFVKRLFELLLLYIVSPFFVSTIPLDDGVTFARWREMFIGKFFSGFGMIFAMKYYMMLIPAISNSGLELYPRNLAFGAEINNILQLFLIIGGAWAVFKSQSLLLELLNPEAARSEKMASALVTGAAMGAASMIPGAGGAVVAGVTGALGSLNNASSKEATSGGTGTSPQQERSQDESQAYRG